ncbi:MAG TPA: response regulator [Dehalococcoidia bacterium]|nr:response regulator [Dehalococcoidia bacterium]
MNIQILLVEDEKISARLLTSALQNEGYQVMLASNGVEGLSKATQYLPDLVILDVMLPGLDGFEVCQRLKDQPATAETPILMLSAKDQASDAAAGRKVGADLYLLKSTELSNILTAVKKLLSADRSLTVSPSGSGS